MARGPVDGGGPPVRVERYAGGELVRRGQQHRSRTAHPGQLPGPRAEPVQRQARRGETRCGDEVAVQVEPVRLDGQLPHPAAAQDRAQQLQPVDEAGADHDAFRVGVDAAGSGQVLGQHRAQLDAPERIAVVERLVGCGGERLAGGPEPGGAWEGGHVRGARLQAVAGTRTGRAGPGRHRVGRPARCGPLRDPGARALTGGEPALGDEFGVGVGDGVAGDTQVGGERPGGRQPGARGQPPAAHRLAQRRHQPAAQPRTDQLQMQVGAESGPGIRHGNGPYRCATDPVASSP